MNTNYNDNPKAGSRPFDAGRGGFIMGEGAGVILLESLESAKKRGAKIYCELVGYGATCDAHHITTPAPEGQGLAKAMEMALQMSGMDKTQVQATSMLMVHQPLKRQVETMAIKTVFGDHAINKDLVVSSTKCVTDSTLRCCWWTGGFCSGQEPSRSNVVPPTINYETPDPDCDLDYVPNENVKWK